MYSMVCLDHISHPKAIHYGTYKYLKFGTAHPSAPARHPASASATIFACTPPSPAATACTTPHGIVRTSAGTAKTLTARHRRATSPARALARQRSHVRAEHAHSHALVRNIRGSLSGVNETLGSDWLVRDSPIVRADRIVLTIAHDPCPLDTNMRSQHRRRADGTIGVHVSARAARDPSTADDRVDREGALS